MRRYIYLLIIVWTIISCGTDSTTVTHPEEKDTTTNPATEVLPTSPIEANTAMTSRPKIELKGDFDGDGLEETLTESYLNQHTNQPINRNNGKSYDELQAYIPTQAPRTTLVSTQEGMPPLLVSDAANQLGVDFVKNEGDLNGDGTDELSYVINWLDQSTLNRVHIVTYREGQWKILQTFSIRETILPAYNKGKSFDGLLHPIPNQPGKVLVKFINEGAMEEYATLDLNKSNEQLPKDKPAEQRFEVIDDSVFVPEFTLKFDLTPRVAELLNENKEVLEFSIDIMGEPRQSVAVEALDYYNQEEGLLYLMNKRVQIASEKRKWKMFAKVSEEAFLKLMNPDIEITINFYSGRKSSKLNIFSAKTIIEPISELVGKVHTVKVELLNK